MNLKNLAGFNWDKANKEKNMVKHGVHYKECESVFFNKPLVFFKDEKHSTRETRYGVFGRTDRKKLLTIFFTIRNNKIRVISARNQNKKERNLYEQKSKN
jgi:hypothetical protein